MLFGAMFTSIVTNDVSDIRRVRRTQKEAIFQVSDFFVNFSVTTELREKVEAPAVGCHCGCCFNPAVCWRFD
eukprot:Skav206647  [mRNA]  locus=scaffold863:29898:31011:- [translate_table: standard]